MAWSQKEFHQEWQQGTARIDDDYEEPGRWYLTARRGARWRVTIAGGGPENRRLGERLAAELNATPIIQWQFFIERTMWDALHGQWG